MSASNEDIQTWIQDAMKQEGINKYKLEIIGSSSKGEGYAADVSFVKVTAELGNGNEKEYNLVIKSGKINENLRENAKFGMEEVYLREIYVYSEIFPVIQKLQQEYGIRNGFKNYPKCYCVCKLDRKEALVFDNLKTLGYVLHDTAVPHNYEHILFVLRTYAKWHGSSLALKTKKPDEFKNITKPMTDLLGKFFVQSNMIESFKNFFEKGLELLSKHGQENAAKKLQLEMGDIANVLTKMTLHDDSEAQNEAVILHGDCWNNNMMFQYNENDKSKPADVALLDYQVVRLGSPIFDLSYYLYTSAEKPVLDKFDDLLKEYHKTLKSYLQQYNINCDQILTLERLKSSWKKYGRFGLAMSSFVIRTQLCREDEIIDFTEKMAGDETLVIKVEEIASQEMFEKRVYDVFDHFVKTFL